MAVSRTCLGRVFFFPPHSCTVNLALAVSESPSVSEGSLKANDCELSDRTDDRENGESSLRVLVSQIWAIR